MPSSYTPPDVIVTQKRRTNTATPQAPQLPLVVIGPARQLVRRGNAGTFTSGDAFQGALPDLAPGAIVDEDTVQVLLDATSDAGKKLGLFELAIPDDAQLGVDNVSVEVNSDIALAYSLLSNRNNNQPDSITDDDAASGSPDGIYFTDDSVDFLSKGAAAGDTDVVISSPASIAGTYRIYELVGSGTSVNEVKVDQLSDVSTGAKTIQNTFNITSGGYAATNNTAIIVGTNTDASGGDVGLISPGGTVNTISSANYPSGGGFNVPGATSADQVTITMPGSQAPGVYTAWNALVALAKVGDYLRIAGDGTSAVNGDFKIVAFNTTAESLTVIRLGQVGTGTATATGGGSATFKLLRVLRGRSDQTNAAGDYVTMTISGVLTEIEIDYAEPKKIHTVSTITGLTGATAVVIHRGVPFRSTIATYDLVKRLTSGFSGSVLVSYEAQRTDLGLNGLIEISSQADIEANLGLIHPNNPIALMSDIVARTGLTDGTRTFFALVTDDNTLASYEAALTVLEGEDIYYIVPTTQDKDIISILKAHVDVQSQPANKHERIVLASTTLTSVEQIVPATGTTWPTDGVISNTNLNRFSSASIDWTLVSPGDMIKILASSAADAAVVEERRILSVDVSNSRATTIDDFTSAPTVSNIFRIDSFPLTKLEQAEDWRDYAKSFADSRVILVRPDTVQITYTDKLGATPKDTQIVVPAYYLAAAFAGVSCSLPPQAPLTNVPIPGIDRIFHSNAYFTPDQLNTIAEGGNCIFLQDTKTSAPYAREQLTTDMTSLATRTLSVVKNVDFMAKFFRNNYRPYIGNKNITAEYLTQLRGIGEAIIRALISLESALPGTQLLSLVQDLDAPDSVVLEVGLEVPYPCNKIFITLFL